ncbi:hypothetical protein Trydic_g6724 [Trypoxylus dichotomus]
MAAFAYQNWRYLVIDELVGVLIQYNPHFNKEKQMRMYWDYETCCEPDAADYREKYYVFDIDALRVLNLNGRVPRPNTQGDWYPDCDRSDTEFYGGATLF